MSSLWQRIRGKAVQPSFDHLPTVPPPDSDADWQEPLDEPPNTQTLQAIAGVSCIIAYSDAVGNASERIVTCQRLDEHAGQSYLWAYCHSRSRVRQFRIDRVVSVCDTLTGEQYASPSAFFGSFATDRHHVSKVGWGLSVQRKADLIAFMNALVFIARCDRAFHPLEREALEAAVCGYWMRQEHSGDPDCASIMAYVDRLAPDAETFWLALQRCAASPQTINFLRRAAHNVIAADDDVTPEEFYWGNEIDEFIRAGTATARSA